MATRSEDTAEKNKSTSNFLKQREELLERFKRTSAGLPRTVGRSPWRHVEQRSLSENLISMLASRPVESGPKSISEALTALNRLITAVLESVEQKIISEEEAESVLRLALSNFLSKRLEEVVDDLFAPSHSKWFFATSHQFYEREKES